MTYFAPSPHTCLHPRYGEIEFTDERFVGADGQGNGGIVAHYTQVVWAKTRRVGCAVGKMGRDWDRGDTNAYKFGTGNLRTQFEVSE